MLIDKFSIGRRWRELLATALQIDVAVAWITSVSLVHDLLQFVTIEGHRIRVISGYDDYLTSPAAMRLLHDAHLLKIGVPAVTGRFHPKVYLFTHISETLCWVGSANLTDAGFGRNVELVSEFVDDGSARAWMDEQWAVSGIPTMEWLNSYEQGWQARQARDHSTEQVPRLSPPETAPVAASLIIVLGPRASSATVEPLLRSAEQNPRIAKAEDFRSMRQELVHSDYRAISLRSFLWLIGWCNTGATYQTASDIYAKPLAQRMFGYVPEQFQRVGPATIDLKEFRYGRMRDADTINTLVEYHRNRLS